MSGALTPKTRPVASPIPRSHHPRRACRCRAERSSARRGRRRRACGTWPASRAVRRRAGRLLIRRRDDAAITASPARVRSCRRGCEPSRLGERLPGHQIRPKAVHRQRRHEPGVQRCGDASEISINGCVVNAVCLAGEERGIHASDVIRRDAHDRAERRWAEISAPRLAFVERRTAVVPDPSHGSTGRSRRATARTSPRRCTERQCVAVDHGADQRQPRMRTLREAVTGVVDDHPVASAGRARRAANARVSGQKRT